MSAMHVAASEGHLKVIEKLLEANADVKIKTKVYVFYFAYLQT